MFARKYFQQCIYNLFWMKLAEEVISVVNFSLQTHLCKLQFKSSVLKCQSVSHTNCEMNCFNVHDVNIIILKRVVFCYSDNLWEQNRSYIHCEQSFCPLAVHGFCAQQTISTYFHHIWFYHIWKWCDKISGITYPLTPS